MIQGVLFIMAAGFLLGVVVVIISGALGFVKGIIDFFRGK